MRKTKNNYELTEKELYPLDRFFNFSGFDDLMNDLHYNLALPSYEWPNIDIFKVIQPKSSFPKVNIIESDNNYIVEIAVAGLSKEDIGLVLKENCLYIKYDKKEESGENDGKYLIQEVAHRSFRRTIRFIDDIDSDSIECVYKDGIIRCVLKKKDRIRENDSVEIDIK